MLESGTERMVVLSNMEGCAKSFVLDKGYSSLRKALHSGSLLERHWIA